MRRTLSAAVAVAVAVSPAHAQVTPDPMGLVPVGATALGLWAMPDSPACFAGPLPGPWSFATSGPRPTVDAACLHSVRAAFYRQADGEHGFSYAGTFVAAPGVGPHPLSNSVVVAGFPFGWQMGWGQLGGDWQHSGGAALAWFSPLVGQQTSISVSAGYWMQDLDALPNHPNSSDVWVTLDSPLNPVAINAVPEPSTYALMTTGLLALGAVARRRRV